MDVVLIVLRLGLALVFATAAAAKLLDLPGSRAALTGFGMPERLGAVGGVLLPLAELAVALALVPESTARWAAVGALVLLLSFIGGIARSMAQGQAPDCHCFGQLHSEPAGWQTLARNAGLAGAAAGVAIGGPGPAIPVWVIVPVALAGLGAALWGQRRAARRPGPGTPRTHTPAAGSPT